MKTIFFIFFISFYIKGTAQSYTYTSLFKKCVLWKIEGDKFIPIDSSDALSCTIFNDYYYTLRKAYGGTGTAKFILIKNEISKDEINVLQRYYFNYPLKYKIELRGRDLVLIEKKGSPYLDRSCLIPLTDKNLESLENKIKSFILNK